MRAPKKDFRDNSGSVFFTIGHSTRSIRDFAGLLTPFGIRLVVDVRSIPRSRKNPQYNVDTLPEALSKFQIDYEHIPALGGLRARRAGVSQSILGRAILFFFTWSVLHHALGGIRHIIWDLGRAHDYPWREYFARATIIGSLAGTILLWITGFLMKDI